MPAWVLQALKLLAAGAALQGGAEAVGALIPGVGPGTGLAQAGQFFGGQFPPGGFNFDGVTVQKKRRRRRRALTASDRADIAFIVGLLGPTAGKNFAVTLAGRSR